MKNVETGMRVLTFGVLHFHLPDDFEGGLSEALRAMADYHDSVVAEGKPQEIEKHPYDPGEASMKEHGDEMWTCFMKTIEAGRRVAGTVCVTRYERVDGEWVARYLNLNTGAVESPDA